MLKWISLEPTGRNPLTPNLLIEDPEDERSVDHDFLTEAISQFREDETVQGALVGAVEDLSRELARMNMNNDFKPYVMVISKHGTEASSSMLT